MENQTKRKAVGIMECSAEEVARICRDILGIIDDQQQICMRYLQDELEELFNQTEAILKVVELMEIVSLETRNEIRTIGKHVLKLGIIIDDIHFKAN